MESSELCRECRAPVQVGARFCAACGLALGPSSGESERRHLTLLFCDLADSTALSERLDPEDLHDLLTSYRRVCQDVVRQYEGHLSQFVGDGVMSFFGYPIAHENDAILATRAALRIVDDVKAVNQGIGKRLQTEVHVRVGLHTGVAVVGEVGQPGRDHLAAVGESVNLAARIQSFAPLDTVVVSASTAKLIEGYFELKSLDAQVLKGFSRPVELFRVLRPTGARTKIEATPRGRLTPHVGRQGELEMLARAWTDVTNGKDRVFLIRGEAGIGKSRFLHHFRQSTLGEGAAVLECVCSPLTQATSFAPIVEMLEGRVLYRAERQTTPAAKLKALADLLAEHSRFGSDALPLMAGLLSIPGANETAIRELSPVRRRQRTLEIMREWIASSAERLPMAILVEDLHWADPSTLEFLDLLVQKSSGGRTLLCMTCRPEFIVSEKEIEAQEIKDGRRPDVPQWRRESGDARVTKIELARLSESEVEEMVTHVAGGRALPPLLARQIAERSEYVPLYVEEVTKSVLESGALQIDANRYELARPIDDRSLPSTLQGSLIARFDRLGESRSIAQLGAAIGREFSYAIVSAVSGAPETALREQLDRLSRSELVLVGGEPPSSTYTFKHALIQEAIYNTLLRSDRARVHSRIFNALQEKFPEVVAARPEMAAYHAEQAGRREAAVPLLLEAGQRALGRAAVAEAVKHLAHAIELVDLLDEPKRTEMEIELQAALGPAYMATLGWAALEVERSSARLQDLATARGDGPRLYQALWSLWTVDFVRGWQGPALEKAQRVHQLAQGTGIPMVKLTGHHAVGYTHFYRGEYEACLLHAEEGLALFDLEAEKQIASQFQLSSSCAIWCFRAEALQMLGRSDEAAHCITELRKLLVSLAHPPSLAYSLCMQCFFFHAKDDVEEVHRLATEARALSLGEGFKLWVAVADIFLAWAGARRGSNAAIAIEKIKAAKADYDRTMTHITEIELCSVLAETLLLANRPEDVAPHVQAALQIARPGMAGHYEAELLRLQGDAATAMRDRDRATVLYKRAVDSARRTGAKALERRAAAALSRIEESPPTVPAWP